MKTNYDAFIFTDGYTVYSWLTAEERKALEREHGQLLFVCNVKYTPPYYSQYMERKHGELLRRRLFNDN